MTRKFDFFDVVIITSTKKKLKKFNGKKGIVRGVSNNETNPTIYAYSVDILNENNETEFCKFIFEEDLHPTGEKADKARMYCGKTIKVRVNPETGEGEIVDKDESKNAD